MKFSFLVFGISDPGTVLFLACVSACRPSLYYDYCVSSAFSNVLCLVIGPLQGAGKKISVERIVVVVLFINLSPFHLSSSTIFNHSLPQSVLQKHQRRALSFLPRGDSLIGI